MYKWRKVNSKILLSHPRITVIEDTVELKNGDKTDYIHFEGDYGATTIIAVNEAGKILLQKEYNYPPNEILYQFPGGGIKESEEPSVAALRELSEESDLTGEVQNIGWFYVDNRRKKSKMHVFVITNLQRLPGEKDPEEELEDYWLEEKEIDLLIEKQELCIYSALASWAIYKNFRSKL